MVLELKTKRELSQYAHTLASGNEMVRYRGVTYLPVDYETREYDVPPAKDRTVWIPLTRDMIRRIGSQKFDILFATDGELAGFDFMVAQNSAHVDEVATTLLVRTEEGLRRLTEGGVLEEPSGEFIPNTLVPMLNTDKKMKAEVTKWLTEILGDEDEEVTSLLHHLATALAPGYSAVKYVLMLGEGRNGKSLLLRMMAGVLGMENVSNVTRQDIAEKSPTVTELNGKLLNLVYDGQAEYLKDSGREKSLIAGEPVPVRRLYESTPTMVQTNALFVEGLNREPKSNDKSSALQKRLVRFQFPNVYALDRKFEKRMLQEKMLGAFLALLIEHYVGEDELAEKLSPTTKAVELQLEHMYVNSIALQFLKQFEEGPESIDDDLLGEPLAVLVSKFQSWRIKENDLGTWAEPDVEGLFRPLINTERKSKRINGEVRKVRVVTSLKSEATAFIESLKGTEDGEHVEDDVAALVAD